MIFACWLTYTLFQGYDIEDKDSIEGLLNPLHKILSRRDYFVWKKASRVDDASESEEDVEVSSLQKTNLKAIQIKPLLDIH